MKAIHLVVNLIFVSVALTCTWPIKAFAVDETQEPSLEYYIDLDGHTNSARIGEKVQVQGIYKNPTLLLRAANYRSFSYGGVAFNYPAYFSWEAEIKDERYKSWTLSGRDFKIMYFKLKGSLSPETYSGNMLEKFKGTPPKDIERSFSGIALKGKAFAIFSGDHKINNEALAVRTAAGFSGLLVFQDSPEDGVGSSLEATKTLSMIKDSFKLQ